MELLIPIGYLVVGFVLLIIGGEALVKSAVSISVRLSLSAALIGMTVVAAGTSAPELAASLFAAFEGKPDIAAGNVIGSNIFNFLAILGIASLLRPNKVDRSMAKIELPMLVALSGGVLFFARDFVLTRFEGAFCILALIALLGFSFFRSSEVSKELQDQASEDIEKLKSPFYDFIYLAVGLAGLAGGAQLAVMGGVGVGQIMGLSDQVIGLTIVSSGTGLPELVTSVVATLRGRDDIAVSNVIGSNLMNTLGVLGATSLMIPLEMAQQMVEQDFVLMIGISAITLALVWFCKLQLPRWFGFLYSAGYLSYLAFLLAREGLI